jgi:hypothetical protein
MGASRARAGGAGLVLVLTGLGLTFAHRATSQGGERTGTGLAGGAGGGAVLEHLVHAIGNFPLPLRGGVLTGEAGMAEECHGRSMSSLVVAPNWAASVRAWWLRSWQWMGGSRAAAATVRRHTDPHWFWSP